jgi:hypothetical protein
VQWSAISALWSLSLSANSEIAVTIATAGAIPPLALLSRSTDNDIKANAAGALDAIRNGIVANRAAAAAAKASADVVHEMEGLGVDHLTRRPSS